MKRILIFSHAMELGGAERALLGLLDSIDSTKYAVDLFLMRHTGELLLQLPPCVRLLPELAPYASLAVPAAQVFRNCQPGVALGRTVGKAHAKKRVRKLGFTGENAVSLEYSHKYTARYMPPIQPETEYDLAISFLTPHYFVAQKVRTKRKIAWIHTDYSVVDVDVESETAMWAAYDRIISISDDVSRAFATRFPDLQTKLVQIENILPAVLIHSQAVEFDASAEMPADGALRLLSIGRFCTAKNFDNVPDICARLRAMGLDVKWYLIGYGGDEALIRRRIDEAGMEEHVVMLGKKENPYPYIRACDLYVQPSRYEGKAVTVREAQLLGKPVAITRYATSASQLEEDVDGAIVPMDNAGCAAGIAAVLRDPQRMARLSGTCSARDYSNAQEVEKLYRLMEESTC